MKRKRVDESVKEKEEREERGWWCWVVGWILDVLEIFMFAEEMGWYVDSGMFHKPEEYGVSAATLTLKVKLIHTHMWRGNTVLCLCQFFT